MSLLFVEGFELASKYGNSWLQQTDLYTVGGQGRNYIDGTPDSPVAGSNGTGCMRTQQGSFLSVNLPDGSQVQSGIISFLRWETSSNLSGTVGQTNFALRSGNTELVSIRYSSRFYEFPYFYVTYDLYAGGVHIGTFDVFEFDQWIRWAISFDTTGGSVSATLYRGGLEILSGTGGSTGAGNSVDNIYLSSRQSYTYYDTITVWDDSAADLAKAIAPHWTFRVDKAEPNAGTYGDWTSFFNTSSPYGTIIQQLDTGLSDRGAQTTVGDSALDITFAEAEPSISLGGEIYGLFHEVMGYSDDPALPNLKVSVESNGSFSDEEIDPVNTRKKLKYIHEIDPATGSLWAGPPETVANVLDPNGDGGFESGPTFADSGWTAVNEETGGNPYTPDGSPVTGDRINEAYVEFDGSNESIEFGEIDAAKFLPNNVFSLSIWLKLKRSANAHIFGYADPATFQGYQIYTTSNGRIRTIIRDEINYIWKESQNNLIDSSWHHILWVYDNESFNVYIDGTLTSFSDGGNLGTISGPNYSTARIFIGGNNGRFFSGLAADAAIWSSDQSANVAEIYNSGTRHDLMSITNPPDVFYAPLCTWGDDLTSEGGVQEKVGPTLSPAQDYSGTGINMEAGDQIWNPSALGNGWYLQDQEGDTPKAYVSQDGGLTESVYFGTQGYIHLYKDVAIPLGISSIDFSFNYKANLAYTNNGIRLYIGDESTNVIAGQQISGATSITPNPLYNNGYSVYNVRDYSVVPGSTIRVIITLQILNTSGWVGVSPAVDYLSIDESYELDLDKAKLVIKASA
jgi:hypothetical protein